MYDHGEFAKEWLFIDLKSEIMIFKIILSAYWSVLLCNCSNTTNAKVDDSFNYLVPSSEKDIFNLTDQKFSSVRYEIFTASNNLTHNLVFIILKS